MDSPEIDFRAQVLVVAMVPVARSVVKASALERSVKACGPVDVARVPKLMLATVKVAPFWGVSVNWK